MSKIVLTKVRHRSLRLLELRHSLPLLLELLEKKKPSAPRPPNSNNNNSRGVLPPLFAPRGKHLADHLGLVRQHGREPLLRRLQ
eukprot:982875-Pyramimonas_sp.AAC.1